MVLKVRITKHDNIDKFVLKRCIEQNEIVITSQNRF